MTAAPFTSEPFGDISDDERRTMSLKYSGRTKSAQNGADLVVIGPRKTVSVKRSSVRECQALTGKVPF